jgi:DNA polymerase-3 subunit gamma/tau
VADAELLFAAIDAAAGGEPRAALAVVERLTGSGRDAGLFLGDLEGHCRELLVAGTLGEVPLEMRVTPEQDARTAEQAKAVGLAAVVRLLDLIAAARQAIRDGADPRTQLELVLLKAAVPEVEPSTQALLARVERLENALRGGGAVSAPAPVAPTPESGEVRATDTRPSAGPQAAVAVAEPEPEPAPEPVAEASPLAQVDLEGVKQIWPAVLETVQGANAMLAALLAGARPAALDRDELTLFFAESASFLKRKAEEATNREVVVHAIQQITGSRLSLRYELSDEANGENVSAPAGLSDEELVDRLMSELDAEELAPGAAAPPAPSPREEA